VLTTTAFVILVIVMITQIVKLFRIRNITYEVEQIFFISAALLLLLDFGHRTYRLAFPAVTNTYEALVVFSAILCGLLYLLARRIPVTGEDGDLADELRGDRVMLFIGSTIAFLLLALASSPLVPDSLVPPVPALRSYWLVAHVVLSFAGEAFFAVAFAASLVYLAAGSGGKGATAVKTRADRTAYVSILIGYVLFTIGALVFGMIWAEQAWGSYWSWDPKETWALVTWLTYTLYLHLRLVRGKKGKTASFLSVAGFLLTMFTFFGVNYLMTGLHSYV